MGKVCAVIWSGNAVLNKADVRKRVHEELSSLCIVSNFVSCPGACDGAAVLDNG